MTKRYYQKGFTLIEISLSLVFVTILALAIALIISNTIGAYQRGITLTQINTAGMAITDDFRVATQNSSAKSLTATCGIVYTDPTEREACEADQAYNFVTVTKYSPMNIRKTTTSKTYYSNVPIYGAFCTGSYSYIWNSGYFESPDAEFSSKNGQWASLRYKKADGSIATIGADKMFKLLKVKDSSRAVCISAINPNYSATESRARKYPRTAGEISIPNLFDVTGIFDGTFSENPEFLISDTTDGDLAMYELLIARPAFSVEDSSLFYAGSFILGTIGGGIDIMSTGKTCSAPNDYEVENFEYCAINKFNFAVQSSGE